jgi:hypothetical protein
MFIFQDQLNVIITLLSWLAPTENIDGTTIDYALSYQIYVDNQPALIMEGSFNPDTSRFEFPLADIPALNAAGTYQIHLTALPTGVDLSQNPERESTPSDSITVIVTAVPVPACPCDVRVE